MVFTPSIETYKHLVKSNLELGSAEGGDQGVFQMWLCPKWFWADSDDPKCGRLPWSYNVEAQYYHIYKNYLAMYGLDKMKSIHFINDGKPWKTLYYDQHINEMQMTSMIEQLSADTYLAAHLYWRYCFLKATGMPPPERSIYYSSWDEVTSKKGKFAKISETLFDESFFSKLRAAPGLNKDTNMNFDGDKEQKDKRRNAVANEGLGTKLNSYKKQRKSKKHKKNKKKLNALS